MLSPLNLLKSWIAGNQTASKQSIPFVIKSTASHTAYRPELQEKPNSHQYDWTTLSFEVSYDHQDYSLDFSRTEQGVYLVIELSPYAQFRPSAKPLTLDILKVLTQKMHAIDLTQVSIAQGYLAQRLMSAMDQAVKTQEFYNLISYKPLQSNSFESHTDFSAAALSI